MVGFVITVHANDIEEASDVANKYWQGFQEYKPPMGHADQFNLEVAPAYCWRSLAPRP